MNLGGLSPWVSSLLTALGIFGTLLGIWLARRGKREDNKRLENQQTFDQIVAVADARQEEINRKDAALERAQTNLDKAHEETEKVNERWERRWERQMKRCREITTSLVAALALVKEHPGAKNDAVVDGAMEDLAHHNEDDHQEDTDEAPLG